MQSPQPSDPWLRRSLGDRQRYRLERRLGTGGMGVVFQAIDTLLDQPVALKMLDSKLASGELRRRFEQEVAVVTALRSQHIVHVSDYGVTPEGYPFYVMEYLQGETLGQLLGWQRSLSVDRAIAIITQVCAGLQLAHQGVSLGQGRATASGRVKVIHRDLKPDNIFLVPTGLGELVKLLDFGIAKIRSEETGYTRANLFLGSFRYAAPEQFEIGHNLDERADIYSLGIILYEMLTGTDPFGIGDNKQQMTGATWGVTHLSKSVLPLQAQSGCEQLSEELDAVVMRCLQKAPEERFSSVIELVQSLHAAVPDGGNSPLGRQSHRYLIGVEPPHVEVAVNSPSSQAPTYLNQPISEEITLSATEDFLLSVGAVNDESGIRSRHSQFLPERAFLRFGTGLTIVLALALGLYYFLDPLVLWMRQLNSSISQKPESSSQPQIQAEVSMGQEPESTAVRTLAGHADTVWAVAIDRSGKILISAGADKTIKLWNLQTGKLLRTLTGHSNAVRAIAMPPKRGINPDEQILASGSGDKTIKLWNLQTGELLRTLPTATTPNTGHAGPVWSVAIGPDGKTLVSGSYDGTIKLWNLQTGELLRTLPEHYDSVWSVAISPDGKTLASGSYDGTIKLWNLQTGKLLHTLSGHTDTIRSVAISLDGKTIASGSWDKTIKLWNLQTGKLLQTLYGHSDRVLAVAFSPSGTTLASSSIDRTIKLWNLQTGKLLHTFFGHSDWVTAIAFGSDGQTLVSGSKDRTVKIWHW